MVIKMMSLLFIVLSISSCYGFLLQKNTTGGTALTDQHYTHLLGLLTQEKDNAMQMKQVILKLNNEMKLLQHVTGFNQGNWSSPEIVDLKNGYNAVQMELKTLNQEMGQIKQELIQVKNDNNNLSKELTLVKNDNTNLNQEVARVKKKTARLQNRIYVCSNETVKLRTGLETFSHFISAWMLNSTTQIKSKFESLNNKTDKTTAQLLNVLASSSNAGRQDFLPLLNQTKDTQHKMTILDAETKQNLQNYQTSTNKIIMTMETYLQGYQNSINQKILTMATDLHCNQSSTIQKIATMATDLQSYQTGINKMINGAFQRIIAMNQTNGAFQRIIGMKQTGPCDRRASHIKAYVRRYINEGHDVTSAEEMKQAIDAKQKGSFRIRVVDLVTNVDTEKSQLKAIAGITQLHNYAFDASGITVWRAYGIGEGKLISWDSIGTSIQRTNLVVKVDWTVTTSQSLETEVMEAEDCVETVPLKRRKTNSINQPYDCPKDGCTRSFKSHSALEQHIIVGNCDYHNERSTHDKAKVMYGQKVNSLFDSTSRVELDCDFCDSRTSDSTRGWALKSKTKRTVFNQTQIEYMKEKFDIGKVSGRKEDPYKAADDMRQLKEEGKYVFSRKEYLTGQQIAAYFSRLALKERKTNLEDYRSAEEEDNKRCLKQEILNSVSL